MKYNVCHFAIHKLELAQIRSKGKANPTDFWNSDSEISSSWCTSLDIQNQISKSVWNHADVRTDCEKNVESINPFMDFFDGYQYR